MGVKAAGDMAVVVCWGEDSHSFLPPYTRDSVHVVCSSPCTTCTDFNPPFRYIASLSVCVCQCRGSWWDAQFEWKSLSSSPLLLPCKEKGGSSVVSRVVGVVVPRPHCVTRITCSGFIHFHCTHVRLFFTVSVLVSPPLLLPPTPERIPAVWPTFTCKQCPPSLSLTVTPNSSPGVG